MPLIVKMFSQLSGNRSIRPTLAQSKNILLNMATYPIYYCYPLGHVTVVAINTLLLQRHSRLTCYSNCLTPGWYIRVAFIIMFLCFSPKTFRVLSTCFWSWCLKIYFATLTLVLVAAPESTGRAKLFSAIAEYATVATHHLVWATLFSVRYYHSQALTAFSNSNITLCTHSTHRKRWSIEIFQHRSISTHTSRRPVAHRDAPTFSCSRLTSPLSCTHHLGI